MSSPSIDAERTGAVGERRPEPVPAAPIMRAVGLQKAFRTSRGSLAVLRDVHLEVAPGECVAIIGASGAGKSTLLHILGALDRPTWGQVWVDGQDLFAQSDAALAEFRNRTLGFVFQFHHLLGEFTAVENVMMPGLISGLRVAQARTRALELLGYVGLKDWAEHRPSELSGGEQQRVAVARALMNSPRLILADEPSGNLDLDSATELYALLDRLRQEQGVSLVLVTHDHDFARRADRTLRLAEGVVTPVPPGGHGGPSEPGRA
jgi:lipoprotein-releasing system ATP-binding protein